MTKRLTTLSIFLCAWASAAAAQTYDPKTGIAELPGSPVAPTSYTQCDTLQQKWSQLSKAIEDAHQKCLDAHHQEPEDPRASFTPSNPVCSHPECQNLHTARIEIGQKSKERVEACRADVAQFQKKQQIAQQRMQALADQQQAQQQQMSALESEIEARKAAAERQRLELERQRAEKLSQIEERHREASEKMAQTLAQNLRKIEQREDSVGAPQASTTPSSVPPMTSGESQMLQGLVAENSADGNGNDANTAALLNGLQQAGGQDNSNQQENSKQQNRDTPIPATGPCGVLGPAGSGMQRGFGTPPTGAPRPMFVAFAFSTLGLHGFGGDGACGVGIDQNEQKAIDQSGVGCAMASLVPDWCGNGNGGHYQVCRADGKTKWVAIAINNDGDSLDWSDGEAIGAETEEQAVNSALANCGRSGCEVKWRGSISCKK